MFAAPADKQPPLRISAILDNSYRNQLGLDINDMVQGDVGVDVTVLATPQRRAPRARRADLLNAEVMLDSVAWRKPKGRPSVFEFDVVKGTGQPTPSSCTTSGWSATTWRSKAGWGSAPTTS